MSEGHSALPAGKVIGGKYTIERLLGEGGMGSVYLCAQAVVGRKVALKLLLAEYATNRDVVARFTREAGASSKIDHPNLVQIFDFGDHDGQPYLVMELLKGHDLTHELERVGPLALGDLATLGVAVAGALQATHDAGLIHRDLKGDNIFLGDNGVIKVLDFGIAKAVGDARLTRTGAVVGTPVSMSPEQSRGVGELDHRSDVYSLGCVLFAAAAGEYPFVRPAPGDYLVAHIQDPPRWLSDVAPWVPREFSHVINRCLEKDPAQRYQSMRELAAALQPFTASIITPPKRAQAGGVVQRSLQLTPVGLRRSSSPSLANGEVTPPPMTPPAMKRQRALVAAALAGVVLLGGGGVLVALRHPRAAAVAAKPAPATLTRVRVVSRPEGATLTVDGKQVGATPRVVEAAPSSALALTLALPGYETKSARAEVGDADSVVSVALEPLPVAPPKAKPHVARPATARPVKKAVGAFGEN